MLYLNLPLIKTLMKRNINYIKTWKRAVIITRIMLGKTIAVHNGKDFINVFVSDKMLNRKLGEFSITRKYPKHPIKDKYLKKKKK